MSNNQGTQPSNGFMPEQAFGDINRRRGPEADVIDLKIRRQSAIRGGVQGLERHVFIPVSPEVQSHAASQGESAYSVVAEAENILRQADVQQMEMGQSASNTIQNMQYDRPMVPGSPEAAVQTIDPQQAHMESIQQEVARLRAQQDQLTNDNFAIG